MYGFLILLIIILLVYIFVLQNRIEEQNKTILRLSSINFGGRNAWYQYHYFLNRYIFLLQYCKELIKAFEQMHDDYFDKTTLPLSREELYKEYKQRGIFTRNWVITMFPQYTHKDLADLSNDFGKRITEEK